MLGKKKFFTFFCIFIFWFFNSANAQNENLLPYKVDFTQQELKFLNSLSTSTLQKIIEIARSLLFKNLNIGSSQNLPTLTSQTQSLQTPYYNSQTGQYQNTPVSSPSGSLGGGGQSQGSSDNPFLGGTQNPYMSQQSNPFGQTSSPQGALGNLIGGNQSQIPKTPTGAFVEGLTEGIIAADLDVKDIDPMCTSNYGLELKGGGCSDIQGLSNLVKQTSMKACTVIKKRIPISSAHRNPSCNSRVGGASASSHMSGMALDVVQRELSSADKSAVFMVFRRAGFNNIGCYSGGSQANVHLDHRSGGPRRWGSDYTSETFNPGNCPKELMLVFGN